MAPLALTHMAPALAVTVRAGLTGCLYVPQLPRGRAGCAPGPECGVGGQEQIPLLASVLRVVCGAVAHTRQLPWFRAPVSG